MSGVGEGGGGRGEGGRGLFGERLQPRVTSVSYTARAQSGCER